MCWYTGPPMRFQTELVPATLLRRYKRFLADCRLPDGREVTAHCPNPGAMTGLADPGTRVWLEPNDKPRRKLDFAWRLAETASGALVCVDTSAANRIVADALRTGAIDALATYRNVRAEVPCEPATRIDFLLSGAALPDLYLEVKSVSLLRQAGRAEFPDTHTARGAKHLGVLGALASQGRAAAVLYLAARSDVREVGIAADIDPGYAAAHRAAMASGVQVLCHAMDLSTHALGCGRPLDFAGVIG